MRFLGNIALTAQGEVVRREDSFWERFKKVFTRAKELDRSDAQALMTTAHLLSGVKRVLDGVGITNAVRLVIDGRVLFEDSAGQTDDVGELFAAFYESEELYGQTFGKTFRELELTVEHRDGRLAMVMTLNARGDGARDEAKVEVSVSARIDGLDLAGVATLFSSPVQAEAYRLQFERFVAKLRDALASSMPEVAVSRPSASGRIVKPAVSGGPVRETDPWATVHAEQAADIEAAVWALALSWAWHPDYTVIDRQGALVGPLAAQFVTSPTQAEVEDSPKWHEDTFKAEDDQGP